jgi:hypothetical protein
MSSPVSTSAVLGAESILVEDALEGAVLGGVIGVLVCQHCQITCSQARARMRTAC